MKDLVENILIAIQYTISETIFVKLRRHSFSLQSIRRSSSTIRVQFRGEDTRTNFVDHLYTALEDRGIITFKDDQKLQRGKSVAPELVRAIKQSRFAIVVFSKNYADSSWCLDELVGIIDCRNSVGQIVLPVFYDVDPSHVRKQTGCFGEAFAKHEIKGGKDEDQIKRWRNALAEAASVSGWNLPDTANGHESQCIKQIVGNILTIIANVTSSNYAQNFIGMESRVQNVKFLLLKGATDEVHIVGIWGMGGAGKTTLARAVFNEISHQFDSICFVANIREVSKSIYGLHSLQEKVLSDVLMERDLKISDVQNGINMMTRLCRRKVLLVLDDIDHVDQLEALVGKHDWFGKGSRIIITTRNEHLLVIHDVNEIHRALLLNYDESLMLFYRHAFKGKRPLQEYADLSKDLVNKVGGLPLALKVLGSDLYGRGIVEWESVVDKLMKHEPNKEIIGVLKISYDGLERNEQDIFLDIACFFLEEKKDDVLETLDCFGSKSSHGLSVLTEKCLVEVIYGNLQMHDMIKELAWDIVYQMDPKDPGKRSRLWRLEDIDAVFNNDTGTEAVEGIKISETQKTFNLKAFKNMKNLRFLDVSSDDREFSCRPVIEYLSNELRYLRWTQYPSESLPLCFQAKKLVYLHLPESNIVQLWKGRKVLDKLKSMDLSFSYRLTKTPDLSGAPNLEKLDLSFCENLKEVHSSLGDLQRLTSLSLLHCESLKCFRFALNMTSLETLNLNSCYRLEVFPQIEGDMKSLKELSLEFTAIKEVHTSIDKLTCLVKLSFYCCDKLRRLPDTIGHLKCLKTLDLSRCGRLEDLPKTLQEMECLEDLRLNGTPIKEPPSSILLSNLNALSIGGYDNKPTSLSTSFFSRGRKSPEYPFDFFVWQNLSGFLSLKKLELKGSEVPGNISQLTNLEILDLRCNRFTNLPDSICQLSSLKELYLNNCFNLRALPKLPSSLAKLDTEYCESLESPGDLLTTKHDSLHDLCMVGCDKLMENEEFSGRRSFSTSDILLQTMLQRRSIIKHHKFSIVVPGTEIADWISVRLEEYMEKPFLEVKLLPQWDTSITGFAMSCESVWCEEDERYMLPHAITISLGHKYNKRLDFNEPWRSSMLSSHVCVWYMSLDCLGKLVFGEEEEYWVGGSDATFFRIQIQYKMPITSHKKFGVRIVYKDDIKHIYNQEEEEGAL